jgi:hypothetical protein
MGWYVPLSRSILRLDSVLCGRMVERLLVGPRHALFCCGQASLLMSGRMMSRRPSYLARALSQRRLFSSNEQDKQGLHTGRLHKDNLLKDMIQMKKDSLLEREKKLRQTGQHILDDIRQTKDRMRERMETVIEVNTDCLTFTNKKRSFQEIFQVNFVSSSMRRPNPTMLFISKSWASNFKLLFGPISSINLSSFFTWLPIINFIFII